MHNEQSLNKKFSKYFYLLILIFIILNLFNGLLVTSSFFNIFIQTFEFSVLGTLNAVIADFAFLLLIAIIGLLIFKRFSFFVIYLTLISVGLNALILQVYVYSSFFQALPTTRLTMQTLANPVEGLTEVVLLSTFRLLFLEFRWIFFIPFMTVVIYGNVVNKKMKKCLENPIKLLVRVNIRRKILFLLSSLSIFLITIAFTFAMTSNSEVATFNRTLFQVQHGGFYSFYIQDGLNVGLPEVDPPLEDQSELVDRFNTNKDEYTNFLTNEHFSRNDNQTNILNGKNVFIMQLEARNNFLVNLEVNGREVTPFLNKLAKGGFDFHQDRPQAQSFYFSNTLQAVGRGNTNDAEFSLLTGLLGRHDDRVLQLEANFIKNQIPSLNVPTLPQLFNHNDYTTMFFQGSPGVFYESATTYRYLFEFDHVRHREEYLYEHGYDSWRDLPANHTYKSWIADEPLLNWALEHSKAVLNDKLPGVTNNFFTYASLSQPHAPFTNLGDIEIQDWGRKINSNSQLAAYLNGVYQLDRMLEEFMKKAMYELPNTLFVLYGDHGIVGGARGSSLRHMLEVNSTIEEKHEILRVPVFFIENAPSGESRESWNGEIKRSLGDQNVFSSENLDYNPTLLRSQRDIFRTIINFFGFWENTTYLWDDAGVVFGVNMFSYEPSMALAVRTAYVKTDDFFAGLLNPKKHINFTDVSMSEMQRQIQVIKDMRVANLFVLQTNRVINTNINRFV